MLTRSKRSLRRTFVLGAVLSLIATLFAVAPASAADPIQYTFNFVNGQTISGVSDNKVQFLPNAGGSDANNPIGMEVHLSCSDKFAGGFGEKDGPDRFRDSAWQIESFRIQKGSKVCGSADLVGGGAQGNLQKGNRFTFSFANGTVITGISQDNTAFLVNAGGSDANNPTGMTVHVSCSDKFPGGFGEKDGPDRLTDSGWQLASYVIEKVDKGQVKKSCSDNFTPPGPPANPSIALIKRVNGNDANTPGLTLQAGSIATLSYEVRNTGNVALTNVALVDRTLGSIPCPATALAVGGSFFCAEQTETVPPSGVITMIADVTAQGPGNGQPTPPAPNQGDGNYYAFTFANGTTVSGVSEDNTAFIPGAGGQDPNNPLGLSLHVSCSDKFPGGFGEKDGPTPGRDSAVAAFTIQKVKKGKVDKSCGEILSPVPQQVSDSDPITFTVTPVVPSSPSIELMKTINGQDANQTGPELQPGETFTLGYKATNTGDTVLNNVTVSDVGGGVVCNLGSLQPGSVASCPNVTETAPQTAGVSIFMDASVVGTSPAGTRVTDNDPINYTVADDAPSTASIRIVKRVNGEDANTAPGPQFSVGTMLNFRYVVQNNGDTQLTKVSLNDSVLGTITCDKRTLRPGQYTVCQATIQAHDPGPVVMTGTVTATAPDGTSVSASDPVNFVVVGDGPSTGPTVCTAQLNAFGQVTVTWSAVTDAKAYQVFRNGVWKNRTVDGLAWTEMRPRGTAAGYTVEAVFRGEGKSTRTVCGVLPRSSGA